jgi:hypothetical protein
MAPINLFLLDQQSRLQALRAYRPDIYTVPVSRDSTFLCSRFLLHVSILCAHSLCRFCLNRHFSHFCKSRNFAVQIHRAAGTSPPFFQQISKPNFNLGGGQIMPTTQIVVFTKKFDIPASLNFIAWI